MLVGVGHEGLMNWNYFQIGLKIFVRIKFTAIFLKRPLHNYVALEGG